MEASDAQAQDSKQGKKTLVRDRAPRKQRMRSAKHAQNITKRGLIDMSSSKKEDGPSVGPFLIAFFLFVVVGSSIFQIINSASTGNFN